MAGRKIGEAFLRVRPDTAGFARDAQPGVTAAGKSFSNTFKGVFSGIAAAWGALFAGRQVIGFLKDAVDEQRESIRVGNLTAAVIKSTGGAARVTAGQVGALADRLSLLAGVDDEAIQGAENLLLTFTNIKNTGTNKIFDQATQAIVDMTAALSGGEITEEKLRGTTLQVGKALNDPIKGITALRRAGVSFTAEQIKQITTLVKTGRTMDAQKIILKELSKEFGGAAAAAADPAQKAQVAWSNFKERLGGLVMPAVTKLAEIFTTKVLPTVQAFIGGLTRAGGPAEGLAGTAARLGSAVRTVGDVLGKTLIPALQKVAGIVGPALAWLTGSSNWAGTFRAAIGGAAAAIIAIIAAIKIWTAVQTVLNFVLTANPIGIIIVAIAALVAGIIYAYKHSETFRKIVQAAWAGIKAAALAVGKWFAEWLWPKLQAVWNGIVAVVRAAVAQIKANIDKVRAIVAAVRAAFEAARAAAIDRLRALMTFINGLPGRLLSAIGNLGSLLVNAGRDLISGLWHGIQAMGDWLRDKILGFIRSFVPGPVLKFLGIASPSKLFAKIGRETMRGFVVGVDSQAGQVSAAMSAAVRPPGSPPGAGAGMTDWDMERLIRALRRAFGDALDGLTLTIDDRSGKLANRLGRAG